MTRNKTVLKAFILLVDWKQSASAFVGISACLLFQTNVKWLFGLSLRKPLLSSGSAAEGGLFQASRARHSGCSSAHSLAALSKADTGQGAFAKQHPKARLSQTTHPSFFRAAGKIFADYSELIQPAGDPCACCLSVSQK